MSPVAPLASATARAAALALALGVASCGSDGGSPRWQSLALGVEPHAVETGPFADGSAHLEVRPDASGVGAWVDWHVASADWNATPLPGVWEAARPLGPVGGPPDGNAPERLTVGGRELTLVDTLAFDARAGKLPPTDHFLGRRGSLTVVLDPDAGPPTDAVYSVFALRGVPEHGELRVTLGNYTGYGFPVWPGETRAVRAGFAPDSTLRFSTAGVIYDRPFEDVAGEVVFTVSLDGEEIFRHARAARDLASAEQHAVPLPEAGAADANFEFAVNGRPAFTAFLTPVIGPTEIGTPGERPFGGEERPDLVILLADTFRADLMTAYDGTVSVTPELDALAARSLVFTRAWSPSSWTLPSHASLFTGLYPHQHGAVYRESRLSRAANTLAERLSELGYHTGAVTDARYVSHRFGIDQGFQWFDERKRTEQETVAAARAFLDADDGRPMFLFVHSFRVHSPYEVSPTTRAEHGERLGIRFDGNTARLALLEAIANEPNAVDGATDDLYAIYRGGAVDLDKAYGDLARDLERRGHVGATGSGYLVFTSDHGEAFGEHGIHGHGNGVWEENVRIPLVVSGPGIEPGLDARPASLVDLPRTFAELAGFAPAPTWGGRSLVGPKDDAPAFSFMCPPERKAEDRVARLVGSRKVIADSATGATEAVFDLADDPLELENLAADDAAADALAAELEELLAPKVGQETATLSRDTREELAEAGYLGYDDEPVPADDPEQ